VASSSGRPGVLRLRLLGNEYRLALVLATLAALSFATMDAMVKGAVANTAVPVMVALRYVVQISILVLVVRASSGSFRALRPVSLRLQLLRGLLLLGSTVTFWVALTTVPLPEAVALSALSPLLGTMLAIPILGEHPRRMQAVAVALGTVGAILVVQPGTAMFRPTSMLPIGTAIFYASFEVTTRRIGRSEAAATSLFYTAIVGLVAMIGWLNLGPVGPIAPVTIAVGVAIGLCGLAGHYFLIAALQRAPVPAVAPISYTGLIWGTLYGVVLFGHMPNLVAAIGIGVIGLGGVLLVERGPARAPAREPSLQAEVEAGTWVGS
jgi:drug/metabolite transporter (DMT)-like permease